jgi:predicted ferric reductase
LTAAARRNRLLLGLAALAVLLAPLAVIKADTGAMTYYLGAGYPPGQSAYIMMRYAGAIAFALVFLQLILGLHGRRIQRWIDGPPLLPVHRSLGLAAMAFAFLHPILFAWARWLRTGQSAVVVTFWPNRQEGFYELHQFYGAIALYALVVGVLAGIFGPRLAPRHWRLLHWLNLAVFILVWVHSFQIGSDTRVGPLPLLYSAMAAVVVLLVAERWLRSRRRGQPAVPSGSGNTAPRAP